MNLKPRTLAVACAACFAAVLVLADNPPANGSPSFDLLSLLNTKVITASKFSEKLSAAPGIMSVITRDELRRFGGMMLREILRLVSTYCGKLAVQ